MNDLKVEKSEENFIAKQIWEVVGTQTRCQSPACSAGPYHGDSRTKLDGLIEMKIPQFEEFASNQGLIGIPSIKSETIFVQNIPLRLSISVCKMEPKIPKARGCELDTEIFNRAAALGRGAAAPGHGAPALDRGAPARIDRPGSFWNMFAKRDAPVRDAPARIDRPGQFFAINGRGRGAPAEIDRNLAAQRGRGVGGFGEIARDQILDRQDNKKVEVSLEERGTGDNALNIEVKTYLEVFHDFNGIIQNSPILSNQYPSQNVGSISYVPCSCCGSY